MKNIYWIFLVLSFSCNNHPSKALSNEIVLNLYNETEPIVSKIIPFSIKNIEGYQLTKKEISQLTNLKEVKEFKSKFKNDIAQVVRRLRLSKIEQEECLRCLEMGDNLSEECENRVAELLKQVVGLMRRSTEIINRSILNEVIDIKKLLEVKNTKDYSEYKTGNFFYITSLNETSDTFFIERNNDLQIERINGQVVETFRVNWINNSEFELISKDSENKILKFNILKSDNFSYTYLAFESNQPVRIGKVYKQLEIDE